MTTTIKYHSRYPGIRSFEESEKDLFFGRDKEKEELLSLIKSKELITVFAKSGMGKTSLLNAGIIPLLEKERIVPIKVRFQKTNKSPINQIIEALQPHINKNLLNQYAPNEQKLLWQCVKACDFERKEQTPLFIFDQFEEYFNHHKKDQKDCTEQLSDLINERLPDIIQEQLLNIPRQSRTAEQMQWFSTLNAKILFLIRSDKLHLIDEMTIPLPAILKTRYHLQALQQNQAKDAIIQPASIEDTNLHIAPFSYAPTTIKEMVEHLSNQQGEIESFQLQILCQHIEKKVKEKEKNTESIKVTPDYLGGKEGIRNILNNYYENKIQELPRKDQVKARKLIEEGLIIENRRTSSDKSVLIQRFNVSQDLLNKLQETRLIRLEKTRLGDTYEISHDTLVEPILKSFEQRKTTEEINNLKHEHEEQEKALTEQKEQLKKEQKLKESALEAQKRAEQSEKKARQFIFTIGFLFLLSLLAGGFAWLQTNLANKATKDAQKQKEIAVKLQIEAEEKEKIALQEKRIADSLRIIAIEDKQKIERTLASLDIQKIKTQQKELARKKEEDKRLEAEKRNITTRIKDIKTLIAIGDKEEAKNILQNALKIAPNNEELQELSKQLKN